MLRSSLFDCFKWGGSALLGHKRGCLYKTFYFGCLMIIINCPSVMHFWCQIYRTNSKPYSLVSSLTWTVSRCSKMSSTWSWTANQRSREETPFNITAVILDSRWRRISFFKLHSASHIYFPTFHFLCSKIYKCIFMKL